MAFSTYFGPLDYPEMQFDEVEKAMFQVVIFHFEVIFCSLTNRNCYFFQVDKTAILVVEWHLEVIFRILTSPKFLI